MPPKSSFPKGWDIWHSENHSSNEETMHHVEKIILPYVKKKRIALKLSTTHPAIVLYNCFRGQTTPKIELSLQENNTIPVQIPANCTGSLWMYVSVSHQVKDQLRKSFQIWYVGKFKRNFKQFLWTKSR